MSGDDGSADARDDVGAGGGEGDAGADARDDIGAGGGEGDAGADARDDVGGGGGDDAGADARDDGTAGDVDGGDARTGGAGEAGADGTRAGGDPGGGGGPPGDGPPAAGGRPAAARRAGADATGRQIAGLTALLAALPPVLLVLGVLPVVPASTWLRTLVLFVLFALLATALNVAFGHTDQLFLFVGGLAGVGAYTTALSAQALGVTAWATLPLAALLCGAIGAVVSLVAAVRRFTVILIAILTLTLQLAMNEFFVGARSVTGGSTGFPFDGLQLGVVADPLGVSGDLVLYYLALALLAGVLAFYVRLVDSRYGLAFAAIREDEVAAAAVGVHVVRYKTVAGFLAAALVGVVGVLLAQHNHYVSPSTFTFLEVDVVVLIMLIVGGLRTTFGPVVGAAIVTVIEELLVEVLGAATQWETAIFGGLLVVLFLYFRSGVVPVARDLLGSAEKGTDPAGAGGGSPAAEDAPDAGSGDP